MKSFATIATFEAGSREMPLRPVGLVSTSIVATSAAVFLANNGELWLVTLA